MPKPDPREFRDDVVRVAANREPGVPLRQIAADFGISETCLQNWVRQAAVETGAKPGVTKAEADEAREAGEAMADRTVWPIASANGWWSAFGKRKVRGKGKKAGPPVHDDLVQREFVTEAPNQLWLTDITEHRTGEGKLYLCAIKDVFSNKIVGYSIDSRMKSRLVVNAINNAVALRGIVARCVVHSDRGSQFRSRKAIRALARNRMVRSMGRVGAAGDNAAMESFFSLLQKNLMNRRSWATRQERRIAIVTGIERTYHRRRRQASLGRLTPVEFETIMNQTLVLAA